MSVNKTESGSHSNPVFAEEVTEKPRQEVAEVALTIVNADQPGVSGKKFSVSDLSDQDQYCIFENLTVTLNDGKENLNLACVCKSWSKNAFGFVRANELGQLKKIITLCCKEGAEVLNHTAEERLSQAATLRELELAVEYFILNELKISEMSVESLTQLQTDIGGCSKYIQAFVCQVIIGKLKAEIEACYKDNDSVSKNDIETMRQEFSGKEDPNYDSPYMDEETKLAIKCTMFIRQNHIKILNYILELTKLGDLSKAINEVESLSHLVCISYWADESQKLVYSIIAEASLKKNNFEKAWQLIEKISAEIPHMDMDDDEGDYENVMQALVSLFCSCVDSGQIERAVKLIEGSNLNDEKFHLVTANCFFRLSLKSYNNVLALNKNINKPLVMKLYLDSLFSDRGLSLSSDQIAELILNQSPKIYETENADLSAICDILQRCLEDKYLGSLKVVFDRMKLIEQKDPALFTDRFINRLAVLYGSLKEKSRMVSMKSTPESEAQEALTSELLQQTKAWLGKYRLK